MTSSLARPSDNVRRLGVGNRLGAGWRVQLDDVHDYRAAGWKLYMLNGIEIGAAIASRGPIDACEIYYEPFAFERPPRLRTVGRLRPPMRRPRQRRSHRSVTKTASGDSGDPDPEPEPPTTRHSATIGGVP